MREYLRRNVFFILIKKLSAPYPSQAITGVVIVVYVKDGGELVDGISPYKHFSAFTNICAHEFCGWTGNGYRKKFNNYTLDALCDVSLLPCSINPLPLPLSLSFRLQGSVGLPNSICKNSKKGVVLGEANFHPF